ASHHGAVHTMEGASSGELHEPDEIGHGATRHAPTAVPPVPRGNGHGDGNRVFASPLARRTAADKGVDLSQLRGSGPGGRIIQRDVLEVSERGGDGADRAAGAPPAEAGGPAMPARMARGEQQVIPLTK